MASSDHLTRLRTIRDNLESELQDETARRAALAAAGQVPPVTTSVGGLSISWNDYLSMMLRQLKDLNDQIAAAGAEAGGIPEAWARVY